MRISDWSSDVCSSDLLLEQLRLVEVGSVLEVLDKLLLAAVEDLDLEVGAGLAVVDQGREAAPGAFQLLELRRMHHRRKLVGDQLVEIGHARVERGEGVVGEEKRAAKHSCGQPSPETGREGKEGVN